MTRGIQQMNTFGDDVCVHSTLDAKSSGCLALRSTVSSSTGSSAAALRMNATGSSTLRGLNCKLLEDRCCVLVPEHIKDASHFAVSDRLRKCPTPVQRRHPFEDRHTRDCHVICSVPQNEQADTLGPTETRWITPTSGGAVTVNIHPDPIEKTRAKQCEKVSFFFTSQCSIFTPSQSRPKREGWTSSPQIRETKVTEEELNNNRTKTLPDTGT